MGNRGRIARCTLIQRFSALCFGALLIFLLVLGHLITASIETSLLEREKGETALRIQEEAHRIFIREDIVTPAVDGRYEALSSKVDSLVARTDVVRIKIWDREGRVIWADERKLVGIRFPDHDELEDALSGAVVSSIVSPGRAEHVFEKDYERLLELYVPIRIGGQEINAVFETYQNLAPLYASIQEQKRKVWSTAAGGFLLLYLLLFGMVLGASRLIERQTAELRRSEEKYRNLVQSAQDCIISAKPDGSVVLFNEAARKAFGTTNGEFACRPVWLCVREPLRSLLMETLRSDSPLSGSAVAYLLEGEADGRDGRTFPVELTISITGRADERTFTVILRDITEKKALQERAIEAERHASAAIVAGSIGHELKNSIQSLMGYAELLRIRPAERAFVLECAEIFCLQSQRLNIHAMNLLELSRPRLPCMEVVDLHRTLDRVLSMLSQSGVLKTFSLMKRYTQNELNVMGDEALIEQFDHTRRWLDRHERLTRRMPWARLAP